LIEEIMNDKLRPSIWRYTTELSIFPKRSWNF